jgi:hypothetical protein
MTLFEMIDQRRSVRSYDDVPISEGVVDDIRKFVADSEQLPGQNARFEVVSSDALNTPVGSHAILA